MLFDGGCRQVSLVYDPRTAAVKPVSSDGFGEADLRAGAAGGGEREREG
jgi:hypothetical protein